MNDLRHFESEEEAFAFAGKCSRSMTYFNKNLHKWVVEFQNPLKDD